MDLKVNETPILSELKKRQLVPAKACIKAGWYTRKELKEILQHLKDTRPVTVDERT